VSPNLYHGIFMLKSNVDTSIELDTIMYTKNKKVWTLGWINMGNDLTREHVFHYRFITTGSRFLWSPCCSYMCFFEFLVHASYDNISHLFPLLLIGHVVTYIVLIKGGASERCDFSQFETRKIIDDAASVASKKEYNFLNTRNKTLKG
jgi:hypothetical protein